MRKIAVALAAVAVAASLSGCTSGQKLSWWASREIGKTEKAPEPYMRQGNAAPGTGFWCDEFVEAMFVRAGIPLPRRTGGPLDFADYPLASPPYQPGDLVFVTLGGRDRYDHVGILQRAEGDHLWVVDGNWPTGEFYPSGKPRAGVVLNERWVGDGAVTEIRRVP